MSNMKAWMRMMLALSVAVLTACGGGEAVVSNGVPLLRVEGRSAPRAPDTPVSSIKSRSVGQAPKPTRVELGPLEQSKQTTESGFGPMLVGVAREIAATKTTTQTQQQLHWHKNESGKQLAAISFTAQEAHGVRLGVLIGALPGSAVLRVYSQEKAETVFQISGQEVLQIIQRNLDAGDRSEDGRTWWTPDIGSAEVTLEIELPAETPAGAINVAVPRVSHIFVPLEIAQIPDVQLKINESNDCNMDAACYDAYSNQRNAVARMVFNKEGNTYLCTGTLMNDVADTGTPYFLSAEHCIASQTVASTLQTDWFFRSPTCNSRTLSGSSTRRYNGAILLYASSSTDTSFMKLNESPPSGAYFAGWDASSGGGESGAVVIGLHHPQGDLLKFSSGSVISQANCAGMGGTQVSCSGVSGNFYRVGWTKGTTEGGSSGSALFGSDGRYVIGTLYAGNATCGINTTYDYYGRFDVAYNAALKQWLGVNNAVSRSPIYRFYNATTGAHFFTPNVVERDMVIQSLPAFAYEGVAFYSYASAASGQSPVFRFYNTASGAHFYTISAAERDFVQSTLPTYRYEGSGWWAQALAGNNAVGVYRFYKPKANTHFYTINPAERDFLIANNKEYSYEGLVYYAWAGN